MRRHQEILFVVLTVTDVPWVGFEWFAQSQQKLTLRLAISSIDLSQIAKQLNDLRERVRTCRAMTYMYLLCNKNLIGHFPMQHRLLSNVHKPQQRGAPYAKLVINPRRACAARVTVRDSQRRTVEYFKRFSRFVAKLERFLLVLSRSNLPPPPPLPRSKLPGGGGELQSATLTSYEHFGVWLCSQRKENWFGQLTDVVTTAQPSLPVLLAAVVTES